jgi:phthiodiolone/phenolphthiodiolone dimycocerosates ketoreductase
MTVGVHLPPKPPLVALRGVELAARMMRLESMTVWDHFQDFFPQSMWDTSFSWLAGQSDTPHEFFDYQMLLGYLATRAGRMRLGVAVTEPVRRHPIVIAQTMLTLAHMTKRAPILGIGTGERGNLEQYGFAESQPVGRLEETLQILRLCFDTQGPITFRGKHFQLDGAVMDLRAPKGRTPDIWVAAHGPRMLRLTGRYGDGWLPVAVASPDAYASRLAVIRDAAANGGRDPDAIRPALAAYTVVASTNRAARKMLDAKPVRFVALLAPGALWHEMGESHPFGDDFKGFVEWLPDQYSRKEIEDALAAVPADALAKALIWGSPEQVAKRLRGFRDAGAKHVSLELASGTVSMRAALYSFWALRAINRLVNE